MVILGFTGLCGSSDLRHHCYVASHKPGQPYLARTCRFVHAKTQETAALSAIKHSSGAQKFIGSTLDEFLSAEGIDDDVARKVQERLDAYAAVYDQEQAAFALLQTYTRRRQQAYNAFKKVFDDVAEGGNLPIQFVNQVNERLHKIKTKR